MSTDLDESKASNASRTWRASGRWIALTLLVGALAFTSYWTLKRQPYDEFVGVWQRVDSEQQLRIERTGDGYQVHLNGTVLPMDRQGRSLSAKPGVSTMVLELAEDGSLQSAVFSDFTVIYRRTKDPVP